ncbi:MAG TPA: 50S ribosomal protein L25/general stress protein Ctc [Terriglobales bacterium]|nr:50S ribosomal protein L25/general stress protein Ctc [Terriglobales bacterium]
MKEITLEARKRTETGKERAKKLRKKGLIPAVVYGPGDEPLPLEINAQSLNTILRAGKGENVIITLNIDGGQNEKKVLIREIQHDPVLGDILHVDFQHVLLTKKITVKVPVHLVGVPIGVSKDGGILQYVLRELEVECLPTDIPEKVEFDVSNLKIGDSIHVKDAKLEKATILSDAEGSIVTVVPPTIFKEEVVPAAAEVTEPEVITEKKAEEGEEAEAEEGKEGKEAKGKEAAKPGKETKAEKPEPGAKGKEEKK